MHIELDYRPEWHQYDFHEARRRYHFRWLCTGVGAGKTYAAVHEALIMATEINPGSPGLIVVPDLATYNEVVKPLIDEIWPRQLFTHDNRGNRPKLQVQTNEGISTIYVRSAHNRQNVDKINGLTIAWAYLEEAGRFKCGELAWKYTLERLRYNAPYNGIFVAASPRPGWLPRAFDVQDGLPIEALRHGYSPKEDYYVRQAKTEWNTANPDHYAQRMRAVFGDGDFARQELDGAIVQSSGLIYPMFARAIHVVPHDILKALVGRSARRLIGGADWGWSNPGACVWGAWVEDGGTFAVLGEWYKPGCQIEQQGAESFEAAERDIDARELVWFCDSAEPRNIHRWRKGFAWKGERYQLNAKEADKAWQTGTDSVRNLMHRRPGIDHINPEADTAWGAPRLYISDHCTRLIKELRNYRDANDPEDETPPKEQNTIGDDHAIDALRYAVYTSQVRGRVMTSSVANY